MRVRVSIATLAALLSGAVLLAGCATAAPEPTPFRPAIQLFVPSTPTAPTTLPTPTAAPIGPSTPAPALGVETAPVASPAQSAPNDVAVVLPSEAPTAEPLALSSPIAVVTLEPTPTRPEAHPKAGLEWVNVRRAPGLDAEIVAKMMAGGTARVVGRNTAGDWLAIQYDESTIGYVSLEVADAVGDVSQLPVMEPVAPVVTVAVPTLTPIAIEAPPIPEQKVQADAGNASVASVAAAPPAPASSQMGCPITSGNGYELVPREGAPADRPDRQHGDLNLALRGFSGAGESAGLVDYSGPTDGQAPQFSGLFVPSRFGTPTNAYRVNIWRFESGALRWRASGVPRAGGGQVAGDAVGAGDLAG